MGSDRLHGLRWPDEIRSASQVDVPDVGVSEEEVDAAIKLAETLSGTDMSELRDEYRDALEKLIQAKAAGTRPEPAEATEPPSAQVVDLMAMLERSVSEAKAARTGGPDATVHDLPAKKTAAAKKQPAKKTAGRKPRSA
ncbi:hypothetical protein OHA37_00055 [Streptomyces sp. NBC_00335]|uniref:hypothetical protein n=1 Tax=unclassified Streptomyces TaxID=2593676 RepID=UPI002258D534|nr:MULTISPECIES: hypothetical protein [unclassified Streptomyces]MCX5410163.1 hypothetical protein [Streptomyces sp. NBC_00086]